jgi:hypothetical protein
MGFSEVDVKTFSPLVLSVACGVFCATLGFSYALATPSGTEVPSSRHAAKSREGRDLQFSDPFLLAGSDPNFPGGGDAASDPDGFELGDILDNVSFERSLMALGGVRPYKLADTNLSTEAGGGIFLDPSGVLFGKAVLSGSNAVTFNATVTDALGEMRSGYFRLNARTSVANDFRFSMDRLATAQVGQDYHTKIEAISPEGGLPFYYVVPGSVMLNGQAVDNTEFNGLTLFDDGTLAGRPLISGTMTFTARATKSTATALNRAGTAQDQAFTLNIDSETTMQSLLAVTSASIKADYFRTDRGSIQIRGILQTGDRALGDFSGRLFILRVGGTVYTTTLDSFGQSRFGDLRVQLRADRGEISVTVRNTDTAILFPSDTLTDRGTKTVVVQMEIGEGLRCTDALECDVRANTKRAQLKYRLGKNLQLGGLYQLTRVQAAEFFEGTAFRVTFLQSPVLNDPKRAVGDGKATVFFGGTFSQQVPLFRGRAGLPPDGVRRINLNNRNFRGTVETYPLTSAESGVPRASDSNGAPQTFYMGVDTNTTNIFLSGDGVRTIFPFFR